MECTQAEILQDAVNSLNNIMLPVALAHVSSDLSRVAKNLHALLVKVNEQEKKEEEDGREADPE